MIEIDLQSGFTGQSVEILVDEQAVFSKEGVATKKLLGKADSITLKGADRKKGVSIQIKVGGGIPEQTLYLTPESVGDFVGVNLEDGELKLIVSKRPFGYG